MRWDLKKPCDNCPFRREGFVPLRADRIEEITDMLLDPRGGTFACHKTTVPNEDEDGGMRTDASSAHCAGALIFADKNGIMAQMARIAGRLGLFNPDKLQDRDAVFDTIEEMQDAHTAVMEQSRKSRKLRNSRRSGR